MADDDWSKPGIFMPKGIPQGMPEALPHYTQDQVKMTAGPERRKLV
jgi:hypothetical protein